MIGNVLLGSFPGMQRRDARGESVVPQGQERTQHSEKFIGKGSPYIQSYGNVSYRIQGIE